MEEHRNRATYKRSNAAAVTAAQKEGEKEGGNRMRRSGKIR